MITQNEIMPRILFVDDDLLTLEMYEKIFNLYGYEVFLAESGMEALEKVNDFELDLIVLDMRLPEMDGIELLDRLKSNTSSSGILKIMASANPELFRDRAIEAGADYFISKPITPEKIDMILKNNKGEE